VNVAIHDANILIDIVKLDLAEALFSLDLNMRTTDAVWAELAGGQKNVLRQFVDRSLLLIDTFSFVGSRSNRQFCAETSCIVIRGLLADCCRKETQRTGHHRRQKAAISHRIRKARSSWDSLAVRQNGQ